MVSSVYFRELGAPTNPSDGGGDLADKINAFSVQKKPELPSDWQHSMHLMNMISEEVLTRLVWRVKLHVLIYAVHEGFHSA